MAAYERCDLADPSAASSQHPDALATEPVTRAAYERFIAILSEASRRVPAALKERRPEISWRRVADIGNHFRHGYDKIDVPILWNVYAHEPDAIEAAVDAMSAATI